MKALFIGLGSMGHKHIDILKRNHDCEIYAFRSGCGISPTPDGVTEITSWEDFDAAFITNPSNMHINTAIKCAERNINLFIEKPLDVSTHGLDRLCYLVDKFKLSAYVAYPFRFHEAFKKFKGYYPKKVHIVCETDYKKWKPYKVAEHTRGTDGVLLELSHEIDIIDHLFGPIRRICGKVSDNVADLHMVCDRVSGSVTAHLDMDSDQEQRFIEVDGETTHYSADIGLFEKQMKQFINGLDNFDRSVELFKEIICLKH